MSFLSLMEATLPPGFRFHPRDEELVSDYLGKKVAGTHPRSPAIMELDLNKIEPWDLPEMACVGGKEWYFFSLRDRKYATGPRTNRATISGYWKATGKDRQVMDIRNGTLVGMRKTLVFYQGRAPKGKKTDWVMHEFRLEGPQLMKIPSKEDWVLCRVFFKKRGILSAKGGQEKGYCCDDGEDDGRISSLPTLTDAFLPIPFDQTPPGPDVFHFQQVPCFSDYIFSHHENHNQQQSQTAMSSPTCTTFSPSSLSSHAGQPNCATARTVAAAAPDAGLEDMCYEEVIKAVLDHFHGTDPNGPKLLEATSPPASLPQYVSPSDACFFSGSELPSPWLHHQCFF